MVALLAMLSLGAGKTAFGQAGPNIYGQLVMQVSRSGGSSDTAAFLYCRTVADDKLTVYKVADGVVSSASSYQIKASRGNLYLYNTSIDQHTIDSLKIEFNDAANLVKLNEQDKYILFPSAYASLKNSVLQKHKITALMQLLQDGIGDYPIADLLPMFALKPHFAKLIVKANIATKRSQADVTDTWTCTYTYNANGLLQQVRVNEGNDVRFTKKLLYKANDISHINTYLNIESRQTVNRTIYYNKANRNTIRWHEVYYVTGKNRETKSLETLTIKNLGKLSKLEPSFTEALSLVKR